jgi:hypothetical protein
MAYLDPAAVRHSPPEGWSDDELAVDVLRSSNRSENVVDVLRYLPYNVHNTGLGKYEVYIETENTCFLLDTGYLKGTTAEQRRNQSLDDYLLMLFGTYPPSFIALSCGDIVWMVDTDEGIKRALNISQLRIVTMNRYHLAYGVSPNRWCCICSRRDACESSHVRGVPPTCFDRRWPELSRYSPVDVKVKERTLVLSAGL